MNAPDRLALGLIGEGALASAIREHDTPLRGFALDEDADPAVVVIDTPADLRHKAVAAALRQGRLVLSAFPPATSRGALEELEALVAAGGRLSTCRDLGAYMTCRDALAQIRDGLVGSLQSIYVACRLPRSDSPESILREVGWSVLDLLLDIAGAMPLRLHATGGALFASQATAADTVVAILRFPGDLVATIEMSRCMPAPRGGRGQSETEVEIIGAQGAIRVEPRGGRIMVLSADGPADRPWRDERAIPWLAEAASMAAGESKPDPRLSRAGEVLRIVTAIEASLCGGGAVELPA